MVTGNFSYVCANVAEFVACCQAAGTSGTALVRVPRDDGDRGPNECEYLARVGKERFRLTKEEKASGMAREDIAKARLELLDLGKPDVSTSEELPADDNDSVF